MTATAAGTSRAGWLRVLSGLVVAGGVGVLCGVLVVREPDEAAQAALLGALALMIAVALLGPLLRSPETAAARSRVSSLSPRELEIAQLAAARRTNAEIAEALHLSEATVKNHLKRIFDKLGLDGGARGKRMLLADVLPKISP